MRRVFVHYVLVGAAAMGVLFVASAAVTGWVLDAFDRNLHCPDY
jgi:hypothetical protein